MGESMGRKGIKTKLININLNVCVRCQENGFLHARQAPTTELFAWILFTFLR